MFRFCRYGGDDSDVTDMIGAEPFGGPGPIGFVRGYLAAFAFGVWIAFLPPALAP
jgi:hypothetical protein